MSFPGFRGLCAICVAVSMVTASQAAITFSLEGSSFSDLNGNTPEPPFGGLTWAVAPVATPFDVASINEGEWTPAFTYGTFSTTDFSFNLADLLDNNDSFTSNLEISPPTPAASVNEVGSPDATFQIVFNPFNIVQRLDIDFDNTPISVLYGNGGEYEVQFLDPASLFADGSTDLQARIRLVSEIPEPSSVVVWSLVGLVGFASVRITRRKK